MSFIEGLSRGAHGVRLTPPAAFERLAEHDRDDSALFADRQRGIGLQLGFCPYRLDLSPAHEALLRRDVERAARELFLQQRALLELAPPGGRTDDPAWTPLVSLTRREVSGAPALEVVHRMSYQPGHELIMGHLLLPVRAGLFELRPFARAATTGLKESLLMAQASMASPETPPDEVMRRLRQDFLDDPARDEHFPDHPLALVRAALRELREGGDLAISAPAPPATGGAVVLRRLGCALTPPPRYLLHVESDGFAQLARLSLARTDGVALLSVSQLGTGRGDAKALARLGKQLGRQAVPDRSRDVAVASGVIDGPGGRRDATVHVTFTRDDFIHGRTAMRLFTDERRMAWALVIGATQSASEEELFAELDGVVRSLELRA